MTLNSSLAAVGLAIRPLLLRPCLMGGLLRPLWLVASARLAQWSLRSDNLELVQGVYEQDGTKTEVQAIMEVRRKGARQDTFPLAFERRINFGNRDERQGKARDSRDSSQGRGDLGDDPWDSLNIWNMDRW